MLEIAGLNAWYGESHILHGVSLELREGDMVCLLGRNGVGKSTTMKMITGFLPPTAGKVRIAGIDVWDNPIEANRRIGYLPEGAPAYPDMTPRGFLDFIATIRRQTTLGLGSIDYVESVLKKALGEDKAASVLGRIMPGSASRGLEILRWMDARSIADMIRLEHPQVIAIILSVLEYQVAADVLNFLPPNVRPEVIQRVAMLETVQPSDMDELEAIMKKQFSNNSTAQSSSFGGIKAAAQIMNATKTELEASVMSGLEKIDADLMQRIQDNMFTFENLVGVDNRGIQVLMRSVEPDLLMTALKGATDPVKNKFFDNMSARARVMFVDDMEAKGPMRISDVEEAQKNVMRIARKLSDAGDLVLAGRGDDFV